MYVYTQKVRVRVKSGDKRCQDVGVLGRYCSVYRCTRYLLVMGLGGEEVEETGERVIC